MLNALWAFMMLTGLGWAAVHGTLGGGDGGNALQRRGMQSRWESRCWG